MGDAVAAGEIEGSDVGERAQVLEAGIIDRVATPKIQGRDTGEFGEVCDSDISDSTIVSEIHTAKLNRVVGNDFD